MPSDAISYVGGGTCNLKDTPGVTQRIGRYSGGGAHERAKLRGYFGMLVLS